MKKVFSAVICIVIIITCFCNFAFVGAANTPYAVCDYDALFSRAYLINGSWGNDKLQQGSSVTIRFRGRDITEAYDPARHFADFDTAYSYYLSTEPDIFTDVPVFVFAPGTYSKLITVRYSAVILGANAGIDPNADVAWTVDGMADGASANTARGDETVFTKGLTRTTRDTQNDAKWAHALERAERREGEKANIIFTLDGVKITGSVGISQYDYSNRLYTDLTLNGEPTEFTPTGNRTTLTELKNSVVDNFSGTGANALFSARCNSMNKNDVLMYNVRLTNIKSSAKFLFNKFFRNLTIDKMYFANSDTRLFGTVSAGSSFCGDATKTAEYDQNIEIKNSVFYKLNTTTPISLGNTGGGSGHTKMSASIHDNFFYDAVSHTGNSNYWGIFLINSANTDVEYDVSITDNVIHQQTTQLQTLFNGNVNYQRSKTVLNFHRNRVTGNVNCIYPNIGWSEAYDEFVKTKIFYDFTANFHAPTQYDMGSRPSWQSAPRTTLASGYDYKTADYYLDYALTVLSSDFDVRSVTGLGDKVTVSGCDITADCTGLSGVVTPGIVAGNNARVEIFSDLSCVKTVTAINLTDMGKGTTYFIKITKGDRFVIGTLDITNGRYPDINTISELDIKKLNLPVITVNTEDSAEIADKENYVTCNVAISNTDSNYCMADTPAGIRLRGNSTLLYADKKAYRIKFDKKQDLFGFGKAKSWVLLANAFDKTMVRNAIAFKLGHDVGLEFTSQMQYVNLYLNGEFQGLYLLCEQTQTGKTRVDVEEDVSGKIDTGYLIELVGNGDTSEDRYFQIDEVPQEEWGKGVKNNWRAVIKAHLKTPEKEVCTVDQLRYIAEYVNGANRAILTQDWESFNRHCDVESFAKYFVVSTILNNGDAGYQMYIYKRENGGKLYAGPLWDFDQSSAASTHCGEGYDMWYKGSQHPWFDSFSSWPEFMQIAKSVYLDNYDEIVETVRYYTEQFYGKNRYDFHANDVRWESLSTDYNRITETVKTLGTYSANFLHLEKWLFNRLGWLDTQYAEVDVAPKSVSLDKTALSLEKGQSATLLANVGPDYASGYEIIWSSTDGAVATVRDGLVTAVADGSCTVTVKAGGMQASCKVTVCTEHQNKILYNDSQHYLKCTVCGRESGFAGHVYASVCDDSCDCGYKRTNVHSFSAYVYNGDATELKDGTKTRVCSACKKKETVTAKGTKIKLIDSSKTFTDVPAGKWYTQYVDFAVTFGIFTGTSKTTFTPDANMTRAQFVQVFANLSGVDTSNRNVNSGFTDVPRGKWFTASVTWAAKNGIVNGVGQGRFDPDANVTREQMCVMIANYIQNYLKRTPDTSMDTLVFTDDAAIADWARTAVYQCANSGLVNGVGQGRFDPKASATRAQGATLFTNFYKKYMR